MPHRFRWTVVVFPSTPAPVFLRNRVHPLVSFISPSECVPLVPARHLAMPSTSLEVLSPLRGNDSRSPPAAGVPLPPMFRPRRFSRPRRFAPPRTSWACFIPQPRPGFPLQGFSPLPSRRASSANRALLSLRARPLPPPHLPLRSLDGDGDAMAPGLDMPPSGRCSEPRSVAIEMGVSHRDPRSPPAFPLLQALLR